MTEVLTKVVVNCADGTSEIVPLSPAEIAQRETDRLAWEAQEAERQALEAAKAEAQASAVAKLTALGLTADEIAALKG
jgi:hypothetical protein